MIEAVSKAGEQPQHKLTERVSWLYSFGQAAEGIKNNAMLVFLLPYYTVVLGLDPGLSGLALGIAVIFDAVSDPLAGWFSDHLKSPWKRRHPFLYGAILPLSVSFYFLWAPPESLVASAGEGGGLFGLPGLFWWLLATAILVRAAMTLYHVPHLSMTAELTQDYDTRTRLTGLRLFFSWTGGVTAYLLALWYLTVPDGQGGEMLDQTLYPQFAAYAAVTMGLIILVSALGTHSEIPRMHSAPSISARNPLLLFRDIFRVLSKRNVLSLVLSAFFGVLAFRITQAMVLLMNVYFWELTPLQMILVGALVVPATACASMLAQVSSRIWDKREALVIVGLMYCVVVPLLVTLRLVDLLPENGTLALVLIVAAFVFVNSTLGISTNVLQNSMMADATDEYELQHHERREGLFYSMNAFTGKAGSALGAMFAGLALAVVNIPQNAAVSDVSPESMFWLGMFDGPLSGIVKVIAILCILLYTLNRAQHSTILAKLAERRAGG